MTAQYVGSHTSDTYKSQLLYQKLRSNLLSLRQFENCYILARWIRNLFKDIIDSPRKRPVPSDSPLETTRQQFTRTTSVPEISSESDDICHGSRPFDLLYPSGAHAFMSHENLVDDTLLVSGGRDDHDPSVMPISDGLQPQFMDNSFADSQYIQNFQFLIDLGFSGFDPGSSSPYTSRTSS